MTNLTYCGSLHNHTDYSNERLRDCIIKIPELIDYAIELGHEVVAITDHETISGHIKAQKYYNEIKKKNPNFKLILGNEIYLCRNGLTANNWVSGQDRYYHFILLAKDLIGHQQIREISTRAYMRSYMSRGMRRVPTYYQDLFDIIEANPGHIIGSTACLGGALPTQILRARQDKTLLPKIEIWIQQLDALFGHGNFYFELQPSNNKEQIYVNTKLLEYSKRYDIPYIITTDSHYLKKEDRVIHKAYLNAQNGEREVDDFYATTYLMDSEELESYFSYFDESIIQIAYKNILKIKNDVEDYSLLRPLKIPNLEWKKIENAYLFPITTDDFYTVNIPMIRTFWNSEYASDKYLAQAIIDGINRHPDLQNKEAYDEINACLKDTWVSSEVKNARWSAYYLNLQNMIDICWEAGSLVGPGRGSGVGFILLYCLDIIQINPLRESTRTFRWRFLNPERASVLDVDFDIEGGRRDKVLAAFRNHYGEDRVANVVTFKTEKPRSAILTAARGLGIDVDIAQYISSLVQSDRGISRTLSQCYYGDKENGYDPIKQFVTEMENYPELWNMAQKIENLICGVGIHAGGVIFVDEPFTNSTALMRAPDGTICTQFELHDCEDVSLIKYDALSVEAMDKIHNCLDLLCENGLIEKKDTLKETYESTIGVYNIERTNKEMWKMVWEHKIQSLFQMEKQSGLNGIATLKPTSVDDLAILNSTIRLMAQEKGGEMPTDKLARFKADPTEWDKEMAQYGLGKKEKDILAPVLDISYGLCIAQEQFMELVQLPELGGFSLSWADKLRKSIAKKNPKDFDNLTNEFFKVTKEKGINQRFANYVWNVLISMSKGYGFNQSHTLAYSLIALQEMNLAFKYPILFWNCACLITDSGGSETSNESEDEDEYNAYIEPANYSNEIEEFTEDDNEEDIESNYEEEDCDGYPSEVVIMKNGEKKKKIKTTNYGKIATAIGKMKTAGIDVSPPDINKSRYTFSPDMSTNTILHGLSGITRVGAELIDDIIKNRPYVSLNDFLNKVKVNKPQMINLIKSGAFDELCGNRNQIMEAYISLVSEPKKRVTLQNMKMLIDFDLLPSKYDFEKRVFNYNKYLKKSKEDIYYLLDENSYPFWETNFDMDLLIVDDGSFKVKQAVWEKIYKSKMDVIRKYIKENHDFLLTSINKKLFDQMWDKYCEGNISKWEMDSISYYSHEHELINANFDKYNIADFYNLPEAPEVATTFTTKTGQIIPLFRISRIAGTVLDRDKNKKTITLLTTSGVVTVRIYGQVFTNYDKQISERDSNGKKHILQKSEFSRGNKIICTGIRRGEFDFICKKYSRTPWHLIDRITEIKENGDLVICNRKEEE